MTKEEIIAAIEKMTVLELADLVKELEQKFGVSAAAPVMAVAAAPVAAAAPAAEAAEEQTEFTVEIKDFGAKKIQVIKAVREVTSLGLKEAKELVESAPGAVVAEELGKDEATAMKTKLEASGATIELK